MVFSSPKNDHNVGTAQLNAKRGDPKKRAGGKFDGTLNQSLNMDFIHRKFKNVDKFLQVKSQEKKRNTKRIPSLGMGKS